MAENFSKTSQTSSNPAQRGTVIAEEGSGSPSALSPNHSKHHSVLFTIFWIILALAAAIGAFFWIRYSAGFEETDDAQVDGHIAPVSTRINGTVIRINVEDNQTVKRGQILLQLDPRDYEVAVAQAKANLAQAKAQLHAENPALFITRTINTTQIATTASDITNAWAALAAAQRDYQVALANIAAARANNIKAKKDFIRYQALINKDEVSHEQFDAVAATARSQAATLAANLASAQASAKIIVQRRAALAQAQSRHREAFRNAPKQVSINKANIASRQSAIQIQQAQLQQALLNLSYCTIYAPSSGIVGKRTVEAGQRVEPGQQLLSITQLDNLWITANFKETQLRHIHPGQRVTIHVDTYNQDYEGVVESMPGATGTKYSLLPPENATGNYVKVVQRLPVRIRIKNNSRNKNAPPISQLRPGMSVEPKVWLD